jgi:hypothetical protein
METVEELIEFIKEETSKVNTTWFDKKLSGFKLEKGYDKSKEKIILVNREISFGFSKDSSLMESIDDLPNQQEIFERVYEIDIIDYCSLYLPIDENTYWGEFAFEDIHSSNYREVSTEIALHVKEFINANHIQDLDLIYQLEATIIKTLSDDIKLLTSGSPPIGFTEVLSDFLKSCCFYLDEKLKGHKSLHNLKLNFIDKLEFNLQQEELVALLYILNKSEFINTLNYNDVTFMKFCSRYFQFRKGDGYQAPKSSNVYAEKYREIIRGTSGNGLRKVAATLKETLKDL